MTKSNISIAFASGKGGTGKTSLAVNFAKYLSLHNSVQLYDLDVEEPNTNIYFSGSYDLLEQEVSTVNIPVVDGNTCDYCGKCSEKCNFNAIAVFKKSISLFPELCKGCGRCINICPRDAIHFEKSKIGVVRSYINGNLSIIEGMLDLGNIHTKSLINDVKLRDKKQINIYDCPPGTTCPMVESIFDADFVVLVTEPTPFGLHDLSLAVEVVQKMKKMCGVVINKSGNNDVIIEKYCSGKGLTIMGKIPFSRNIAQKCGNGKFCYGDEMYDRVLSEIYHDILGATE